MYLSPRNGYISIFRKNLETGERHTIVTGGRSEDFESFHPFSSRIDVSRPGYLLFSTQRGDRDALMIWDMAEGKPAGRYQFADLVSVLSPVWAKDGQSIFFSGLSLGGISDLYRVWLPDGRLEKLTDDRYQDLDPSVGPDGRRVVFASDRTADGLVGAVNLFVLDLETRDIRQLTSGPWVGRDAELGRQRPDLLHLQSGRHPQHLLGGLLGCGTARNIGMDRCLRRCRGAGEGRAPGERLSMASPSISTTIRQTRRRGPTAFRPPL